MSAPVDLRSEIISGDPTRQSRALLAVLGLLSAGRDVAPHISLICQAVLGNANVTPSIKCTAYDIVAAAAPTDADLGRAAAAVMADIQKGSPPELRTKALDSLSQLPPHRLVALLHDDASRERVSSTLHHPTPAVRAAAIAAVGSLWTSDPVPAAAHDTPAIAALLDECIAAACDGLTDDDGAVVQASCRALTSLLHSANLEHGVDGTSGVSGGTMLSIDGSGMNNNNNEGLRASSMRSALADAALSQVDGVFGIALARCRTLSLGLSLDIPALLTAYLRALKVRGGARALDSLPGDAAAAHAHAFEESAALLAEMVRCGDPAVVLAATQGLLELAEMDAASATLQALLPSAVSAAVSAAHAAGGHQRSVVQHAVLSLLLKHLEALPSVQRVALFQILPPMIAAMPAAQDRVCAFFQLWSATTAYDWAASGTARPRTTQSTPTLQPQLQSLLTDRHIKEAISGAAPPAPAGSAPLEGLDPPHSRYRDPIFREELVGCLLHVLLTHPRPTAAAAESVTAASSAVSQASTIQSASAAVDWLGSAKLALQGTKPCLGWDRVAGVATTGTTAAVDLWLQLLLRCIQVAQGLRERLLGVIAPPPPPPGVDGAADPGAAVLAALVRRASDLKGDLQGLLLQIAANWRALHPVARPRAVWLCACHLRLRSVLDASWTSLADALRGLMADASTRNGPSGSGAGFAAAVAQGRLRAVDGSQASGGGGEAARHQAAVAAGSGEAEEVAVLALERLAGLVASNHTGKLVGQLAPVAGMLDKLASLQLEHGAVSPPIAERLVRVQLQMKPVATAGKKQETKKEGQDDATARVIVVELISAEESGGGGVASYPSTLPPSPALLGTAEVVRYRRFLEQLQSAALTYALAGAAVQGGNGNGINTGNAFTASSSSVSAGLPSLQQVASVLEGSTSSTAASNAPGAFSAGVAVTGPATPVCLRLSHAADPGAGTIRLRCAAANRTLQSLTGVEVTLLLGGPVAGTTRRPLTYRLAPLPPHEVVEWEVPLRVAGFGWPTIQPALTLPASVPTGVPSLRCRPYSISPLQLLAPPSRTLSPAEFYQRWQALANRACVAATPTDPSPLGIQRLLSAIETAGLGCVMKAVVPVAGGVHAAFHGAAWSGESIACVVTSGAAVVPTGPPLLNLHFGSEAAEVVTHIRGHEGELLAQLTGGLAIPAAGANAAGSIAGGGVDVGGDGAEAAAPEERERHVSSTFSFLRTVTAQMEAKKEAGAKDMGDGEAKAREAAAVQETEALGVAAVAQWQKLQSLRVTLL